MHAVITLCSSLCLVHYVRLLSADAQEGSILRVIHDQVFLSLQLDYLISSNIVLYYSIGGFDLLQSCAGDNRLFISFFVVLEFGNVGLPVSQ